jgi:hypothetical protein
LAARRRQKLDHGLMWDKDRSSCKFVPEHLGGSRLLLRKSRIDAIHQFVGVNQRGHARRDPPASSSDQLTASAPDRMLPGSLPRRRLIESLEAAASGLRSASGRAAVTRIESPAAPSRDSPRVGFHTHPQLPWGS